MSDAPLTLVADVADAGAESAAMRGPDTGLVGQGMLARFTRDGVRQMIVDIQFAHDPAQTNANPNRPLDLPATLDSEVFELRWLQGYGMVKSLQINDPGDPNAPSLPGASGLTDAFKNAESTNSPLVLDLDNDGIETVGVNQTTPLLFDIDAELLGDATPVFDALDTRWTRLRVWQDTNQDGISQATELKTLAQLNITSIRLAKAEHPLPLANGNVLADLSSYTRGDGTQGGAGTSAQLADIDLAVDSFHSQFADRIPLTTEAAQLALLDPLLKAWSDTRILATTSTGAYAGHPLTVDMRAIHVGQPEYQAWADKLTIMEHFNGRTHQPVPEGNGAVAITLWHNPRDMLQPSYEALKSSVYLGTHTLTTDLQGAPVGNGKSRRWRHGDIACQNRSIQVATVAANAKVYRERQWS